MIVRTYYALLTLGILALLSSAIVSAVAASNSVARSNIDTLQRSVGANDLKPAECSAQNVSTLITGSGIITGTSGNDLILGSPGADVISGGGGNDCIVGGGGIDTLIGGTGTDTCLRVSGSTTIDLTCENHN